MENNYTDSFLIGLIEFFIWAKWLLVTAFFLTMADLKFGISAAKYRKEEVKRSRAVRRTLDKITNYCLWVILAYTFGEAFGKPFGIDLLPLAILIIIYGVELESIYVNFFAARGKSVRVNFLKFFGKKTDLIDVEEKEDNNG